MANQALRMLIQHLHSVAGRQGAGTATDAELLERFAVARDQAAFEVLVWRHGPMVLNLCRRILRHEYEVEDVDLPSDLPRQAGHRGEGRACAFHTPHAWGAEGWRTDVHPPRCTSYSVAVRFNAAGFGSGRFWVTPGKPAVVALQKSGAIRLHFSGPPNTRAGDIRVTATRTSKDDYLEATADVTIKAGA